MDRRAVFFVVASMVGFIFVPIADPKFRWVAVTVGVTYLILALLSALDAWSRKR